MIKCENACPRGKFDGCCHKCPDFHTCPDSCQENPNACGSATFDISIHAPRAGSDSNILCFCKLKAQYILNQLF